MSSVASRFQKPGQAKQTNCVDVGLLQFNPSLQRIVSYKFCPKCSRCTVQQMHQLGRLKIGFLTHRRSQFAGGRRTEWWHCSSAFCSTRWKESNVWYFWFCFYFCVGCQLLFDLESVCLTKKRVNMLDAHSWNCEKVWTLILVVDSLKPRQLLFIGV